jgi:DNA-binding transcriptional ArsR family regulator
MSSEVEPITTIDDPRYVKALAHPLRIRILAMLQEQPASPVQLSERLSDTSLGAIAYHVRTLLNLGLLELVATRQRRGATEHVYRAVEHPRFTDQSWEALGPVAKQRLLTAMLQQIGEYASSAAALGGFDRGDAQITRTALRLDERGWTALAAATKKWLAEVQRIEEGARDRIERGTDPHDELDVGLVIMLFEAVPVSEQPPPTHDGRPATAAPGGDGRPATAAPAGRRARGGRV